MSASELAEWDVYLRKEPLPDHNWNAAQVCSVIANVNGNNTKLEQFLPRVVEVEEAGERPTAEACAGILGRKYRENEQAAIKRIALGG